MSGGFAVFNGHVNNADQRARQAMRDAGEDRCLAEVEALEREGGGIMHIFNYAGPNWGSKAVQRYVALVTAFVNENRTIPA